jgi:hypothetical protein
MGGGWELGMRERREIPMVECLQNGIPKMRGVVGLRTMCTEPSFWGRGKGWGSCWS